MTTVADGIAAYIAERGVDNAFGIIGAGNAALFDAITRLGKTEIVCVHHEQAAVMCAAYWGRIRGVPGVAIVTTGAGSSNAATGVLAAQMDSVGTVVISGNEPSRYLDTDCRIVGVQGFKTAKLGKVVGKESWTARSVMDLDLAFHLATVNRPGPVWLDYPRDRFNEPA